MKDLRTPSGHLQTLIDDTLHRQRALASEIQKLQSAHDSLELKLEQLRDQKNCAHQNHYKALLNGQSHVYVCPECKLVWEVA